MLLAVRRIVYRALVVGLGEFLLACMLVPLTARSALAVGYPLFGAFLAFPAALVTLVEVLAADRPQLRRGPGVLLTSLAAMLGIVIAHFQAVYAGAVLETLSVPQGIVRAHERWHELFVVGTGDAPPIVIFFLSLALPFTVSSMLAHDRSVTTRSRIVAFVVVTIVTASAQELGRIFWSERILEHAAIITSLSLPVFFALVDALAVPPEGHGDDHAPEGASAPEQKAR